jgi:hypothetical protein
LKKKPITKRAGGVAQGVGPEVQAPVLKKKKKKRKKEKHKRCLSQASKPQPPNSSW